MRRQVRGSRIHRPQFVTGERPAVFSDADLRKDRRTRALKTNGDDDNRRIGQQNSRNSAQARKSKARFISELLRGSVDGSPHHGAETGLGLDFRKPPGFLQFIRAGHEFAADPVPKRLAPRGHDHRPDRQRRNRKKPRRAPGSLTQGAEHFRQSNWLRIANDKGLVERLRTVKACHDRVDQIIDRQKRALIQRRRREAAAATPRCA